MVTRRVFATEMMMGKSVKKVSENRKEERRTLGVCHVARPSTPSVDVVMAASADGACRDM